jgi:hypothetical protein
MKAKFYFRKDVANFGFGMDSNHRFWRHSLFKPMRCSKETNIHGISKETLVFNNVERGLKLLFCMKRSDLDWTKDWMPKSNQQKAQLPNMQLEVNIVVGLKHHKVDNQFILIFLQKVNKK